jgi:protease I
MHTILQKVVAAEKPCGAICIATRILAQAGLLAHKKATGWDGDLKLAALYQEHRSTYVKTPVVIDGKIITAQGPDAAKDFGNGIVSILKK